MEEVHDLPQQLLGLVLPGHVGKADAGRGGHIYFGPGAAAHAEHHAVLAAHGLLHPAVEQIADEHKGHQGQHPVHQQAGHGGGLGVDLLELGPGVVKALGAPGVLGGHGLIDLAVLIREQDLVVPDLHLVDLLLVRHGHEHVIGHVFNAALVHRGEQRRVEQQQDGQGEQIVVYQGFFRWLFDLLHLEDHPLWVCRSFLLVSRSPGGSETLWIRDQKIVNRLMGIVAKDRDKIPV